VAVNKIDSNNIHKYGVINPGKIDGRSIDIIDIVEKPKLEDAPSNIAVCGRYILNSSIFDYLKKVKPDNSGEIQLTDAIKMMLESESVSACIYEGEMFDCGSKKGFVEATIAIALRDPEIRDDIKSFIAKEKF
jgi:UTP--glucose-1-phosphate uridylyltransferase